MKSNGKGASTDLRISAGEVPRPEALGALFSANKAFLHKSIRQLAKINPRELDSVVHNLHEQAFSFYDCLDCANCCRSISPAISHNDVDGMARKLKMRPSEMVSRYLQIDGDGDFVFHAAPCPFIDADNYCSIYSHRPKACREYPHTDRSRFYQLLNLSLKNAGICPVVYAILMKLSNHYSPKNR